MSSSNRHIQSIDGLRAVAVIAVMLYHLGLDWIPGGFLGVDLFFVISGYVITGLILDSIEGAGALDLRAFYLSRIRRLVPALVAMVVFTILFIGVYAPDTIRRFLADLPYVFTGTMNWALVAREQDYFSTIGRPPLLQHTWSLAVEAQFYLIWQEEHLVCGASNRDCIWRCALHLLSTDRYQLLGSQSCLLWY
jgi:peptidoglycan/LPS O-acetylase OafA/YrhL